MPTADATAVGLVLCGLLVLLAGGFAALQLRERKRRPAELSAPDRAYFRWKDARRLVGSTLMLLTAAGMAAGLWIDPSAGRAQRQAWSASWLTVMGLILILLVLAFWDWLALRPYARRALRRLDLERHQAAAELARLRQPPQPPGPPPQRL